MTCCPPDQVERRFMLMTKSRWAKPFPRTGCALCARRHNIREPDRPSSFSCQQEPSRAGPGGQKHDYDLEQRCAMSNDEAEDIHRDGEDGDQEIDSNFLAQQDQTFEEHPRGG